MNWLLKYFQSEDQLRQKFNRFVAPLNDKKGGGAYLNGKGFYRLKDLNKANITQTDRGGVTFVLLPTISDDVGHWVVIITKGRGGLHNIYYNPADKKTAFPNNIPPKIKIFLQKQGLPYRQDYDNTQTQPLDPHCGLHVLLWLKKQFS
jgi:hypothetical protein